MDLQPLIQDFANRLVAAVETATNQRVQAALAAVGVAVRRGPGRPPKNPYAGAVSSARVIRRKAPKQLCPVPGCKNPAAPVFGMVCAKHKDLPKSKIKQYRDQRRAAKEKAAA